MRTNIEIDDTLMEAAMSAGPYKTKRDAVEAGLALLARQAAYREILKWEGKLKWDGEPWSERDPSFDGAAGAHPLSTGSSSRKALAVHEPSPTARRPAHR